MPFNAAGVYTPIAGATTASPGDVIRSATWNSINTDYGSVLTLLGQQLYGTTSVTSTPYVPVATDSKLLVNIAGASVINLPTAASRSGYPLAIKDISGAANTNNITINRNSTDTIEGLTSIKINANYGGYWLFPVAAGWIVVASTLVSELAFIAASGLLSTSASSGIGYTVGSGGAVTQITSRTTAVTLNNVTGAITLFAAAPVVGTYVTFTVNNTSVAATDVPHIAFKSGTNTYIGHVSTVAANSFSISFTSVAGTASDSPVINFAVTKGSAT